MPDELRTTGAAEGALTVRDEGSRMVDLRLVPWDTVARTEDGPELFRRGAFAGIDPTRVTIESGRHGGPLVGRGVSLDERDDAAYLTARIAPTPAGDELLTLAREGVYSAASVAFYPVAGGFRRRAGATEHSRADLRRVAILERGSYPGAAVLAVRSPEDPPMPATETPTPPTEPTPPPDPTPEPPADDGALRFRDEMRAELGAIRTLVGPGNGTEDVYAPLRVFTDFGLACRAAFADPAIGRLMTRALADEVTPDNPGVIPPGWISTVAGIIPGRQAAITAFGGRGGLPDAGMDINWPYYDGDLAALVQRQAAEKTAVNSAKISFKRGTAPIASYGFAHDVSYQLILRSSPSYIASANRILVAAFAIREDIEFVDSIVAADATGGFVALDPLTATADALRAALFEASVMVEEATGAPADFALAATDVFTKLGGLNGLYPSPYGTSNVAGTAQASDLRINVSGLSIIHEKRLPAGSLVVSNGEAAGYQGVGPLFVTAEDVERLGRNEAIWGMGGSTVTIPKGIVWIAATAPTTSASERRSSSKAA